MTIPNVAALSFKPVIEELFSSLSRYHEEQRIRAYLHYDEFEEAAVHEDANAELLEVDAPALNWVGYSTFLAQLVADCAARKSAA